MPRTELGELLLARGLLSRSQLDQALERQHSYGGRLGTCLLEIGAVSEQNLLRVLSEQLQVPSATKADLENLAPDIIALLPAATALSCSAVPLRRTTDRIDVALLDPGDLAIEDELSFSMGRRIRPHLASELRIIEALHKYYGGAKPLRFQSLIDRFGGEGSRTERRQAPQPAGTSPVPAYLRPGSTSGGPTSRQPVFAPPPVDKRSIPLTAAEREALAASRRPILAAVPEHRPLETVDPKADGGLLGQLLSEAETASQIGAAVIRVLADHFPRVLLFRASSASGEINGWMSHGPGIDLEWSRHYSVGLHQATVFRDLAQGAGLFAGRLEATPAHKALARCWQGTLERECLFLPVSVRGRLVCAVYMDRGDFALGVVNVEFLNRVAKMTALAFERCILRRKLQMT